MSSRHRVDWPKRKPLENHMPPESEATQWALEVLRNTHPDADPIAVLFEQATDGKSAEGVRWQDVYSQIARSYQIVHEEAVIISQLWEEQGKEQAIAFLEGSLA